MRTRTALGLVPLVAAAVALPPVPGAHGGPAPQERTFSVTYTAKVHDLPPDAQQVRLWLPYPQDTAHQTVHEVAVDCPYPFGVAREPEYGNRMVYVRAPRPADGSLEVEMAFTVTRREVVFGAPDAEGRHEEPGELYLRAPRLGQVVPRVRELAARATEGRTTALEKARGLYDVVAATMEYDKSAPGWGRGDVARACEVGKGNCSDYHGLLIAMAQAEGMGARFEIGLPFPYDFEGQRSGSIGGYHCWASVWIPGGGWLGVDISEADKPHLRERLGEYNFGHLAPNRVTLSTGRDITLAPPQDGPPVNIFFYPYVEVDGAPFESVEARFTFQEQ